jgi:hypothetical protein
MNNGWTKLSELRPGEGQFVWVYIPGEAWITLAFHIDLYSHNTSVEAKYIFRHFRGMHELTGVTHWQAIERPDGPVPLNNVWETQT